MELDYVLNVFNRVRSKRKQTMKPERRKILTLPRIQVGERKVDRFGNTQNTPTHKSATARLARKKFVILLKRGLRATANNTSVFPENKQT